MLLQRTSRHDNRVLREARALAAAGHDVAIVELAAPHPGPAGVAIVSALPPAVVKRRVPFKLHRLVSAWTIARAAARLRPDAVHAHDVAMLPSGWLAARLARARLVYDTHELATGVAYRTRRYARLVWVIERLFVPRADAVVTVSEGIAARLGELYRLQRPALVVRNLPDTDIDGPASGLRAALGLADETPIVLHQGAPAPDRGCETLVRAAAELGGVHVVFLGDGEPGYVERLRALAADAERVHFLPARPPETLLAATRDADVGVSLLEPICENHRLALPNKVFEYVAAGVPVVASDLPELRRLIESTGVGVLVDPQDPASVAAGIERALEARAEIRAAQERVRASLGWGAERGQLTTLYDELAPDPE